MRPTTRKIARDYGGAILAAVIIALLIRMFLIEAYRIPTSAMHPTLEPGDTIFVAKWPLGFNRKVERGDVLVFSAPSEPDRDYVKRTVAVAGDLIQVKKGHVLLNGKEIQGPAVGTRPNSDAACGHEQIPDSKSARSYDVCWEPPLIEDFGPEKVAEGSVFVLGDLRSQTPSDGKKRRTWGAIPLNSIKGKALWIWLSVEPHLSGMTSVRFPNFRFERMFRRIE